MKWFSSVLHTASMMADPALNSAIESLYTCIVSWNNYRYFILEHVIDLQQGILGLKKVVFICSTCLHHFMGEDSCYNFFSPRHVSCICKSFMVVFESNSFIKYKMLWIKRGHRTITSPPDLNEIYCYQLYINLYSVCQYYVHVNIYLFFRGCCC